MCLPKVNTHSKWYNAYHPTTCPDTLTSAASIDLKEQSIQGKGKSVPSI